ncbi:MAG TPA: UbiA family prenyltransferase [Candidatus Methanoperedenaceae archaeon]|nr:UbiA family prenyltransferase [Candidatus Methanoperedenaceae archaeon]
MAGIRPYIDMLRPEIADMDLALPAATALLATYTSGHSLPGASGFAIAVIGGYFAITSSYVFNDFCDVDIDSINLPGRPLPSGRAKQSQALLFALLLATLAGAAALFLNPQSFAVFVAAVLVITFYSAVAKRKTFLSFVPVGIAYGLVPVGVWLAFDPFMGTLPVPALLLGAMICVTDWGFTLAGVSRDIEGDRAKGAPTMPVTHGIPITSKFIFMCWLAGIALSFAIGYTSGLGPLYYAGAAAAGGWMLVQAWDFVRNSSPARGGRLFLQGSRYRGVMFGALIIDILVSILVPLR